VDRQKTHRLQVIYIINKCALVAWLVGDYLLLCDFRLYGHTFYNRCHGYAVKEFWDLSRKFIFSLAG
jgi:hypothetical protein